MQSQLSPALQVFWSQFKQQDPLSLSLPKHKAAGSTLLPSLTKPVSGIFLHVALVFPLQS